MGTEANAVYRVGRDKSGGGSECLRLLPRYQRGRYRLVCRHNQWKRFFPTSSVGEAFAQLAVISIVPRR